MTKDDVHLRACDYAQKCQEQITLNRMNLNEKPFTHDQLQGIWLNHYDGFAAGYRAALGEFTPLLKQLLGILESEYEGTEMFQDEIKELKGLL